MAEVVVYLELGEPDILLFVSTLPAPGRIHTLRLKKRDEACHCHALDK